MNCDLHLQVLSRLQENGLDVVGALNSEVRHSHRVVPVEQSAIDFAFCRLQTSTSHVGLTNCLNLLEPVLVAQLIEDIVKLVQESQQLFRGVVSHNVIEPVDVKEDQAHFSLGVREVLLALSHLVTDK
jgi:hypothetical protein